MTKREKYILTKRFGLDGKRSMTLKAIANQLHIGSQRVGQLEKKTMRYIHRQLCKMEKPICRESLYIVLGEL